MSQSIGLPINLKHSREKLLFRFFRFLNWASLTYGYLWCSSSISYAANDNSNNEIIVFIWGIPIYSHGIEGFTDQQTAFTHAHAGLILQSRNFNLRVEHGRKSAYP